LTDLNHVEGVAGLKKYDVKTINIVFMIYCLVAAGAFGIEEMIPASGPGITLVMLMVFPFIWACQSAVWWRKWDLFCLLKAECTSG
jgi:hypothetical protein